MGACRWSHANMQRGKLPPSHAGRLANGSTFLRGAGRPGILTSGHVAFRSGSHAAHLSPCRDAKPVSLQTVGRSALPTVKQSVQRVGNWPRLQPAIQVPMHLVDQANSPSVLRSNRHPVRHANSQTGGPPDCSEGQHGESPDMLRRSNRHLQIP